METDQQLLRLLSPCFDRLFAALCAAGTSSAVKSEVNLYRTNFEQISSWMPVGTVAAKSANPFSAFGDEDGAAIASSVFQH